MKWNIVCDSACDLTGIEGLTQEAGYATVPMKINFGPKEYVDDASLDRQALLNDLKGYRGKSGTACPSPDEWAREFRKAENTVAVTISSELSGSHNSAMLARTLVLEECPEKKICIVDSKSAGPGMAMLVYKARELILAGKEYDEVAAEMQEYAAKRHVLFGLCSFENLVRNGRMHPILSGIANTLRLRLLGSTENGAIKILNKIRGDNGLLDGIVEQIRKRGYQKGRIIISHCDNLAAAARLQEKIRLAWADAEIVLLNTRGLCSFYAEHMGLIVAF